MRSLHVSASALLLTLSLVMSGATARAADSDINKPADMTAKPEGKTIMLWNGEKWMLDYTNWVRARFGAPQLIIDPKLQESCRRHCAWMARNSSMVHSSGVAENIAMGQSGVPDAMNAWQNSSGHFANMVNRGYRVCGMACYKMPNGQRFYCQQFSN